MLKNYFKIAWRNLVRNRVFSAINIAGLAIGLASCMLISLYVIDELRFDRFHEKSDRIVRVTFKGTMQGGIINESHAMPPTAAALKAEYPEVLESTRLRHSGKPLVMLNNQLYNDEKLAFVDSNFFSVFTFPFIAGNAKTALLEPNTIVLSETTARKYFGKTDVVGKIVTFKDWDKALRVTGVMKDMPSNSHLRFDLLGSMVTLDESRSTSWLTSEFFTYLLLPKGYDYKKLEAKLPATIDKYISPQLKQSMGVTIAEFRKQGNNLEFRLQPLTDIHLHSDFEYDLDVNGDITYVYIFGAVAVMMLLIACINFMNLSTAGSSKRAREVGVRKVMGSEKSELVGQFLTESILLTSLALVLAILLSIVALPVFNDLSGKNLSLQWDAVPGLIPAVIGFALFVGIFAGSYPAFFLSSFKPITVLKGGSSVIKLSSSGKSFNLRSGLVVFQFFMSIILIVGTTVVFQQLQFIRNKKLGYNKDQVIVVPVWSLGKNMETFREGLIRDSRVANISLSGYVPAGPSDNNNFTVNPDGKTDRMVKTLRYEVDYNYLPTLGMEMARGRNFSKEYGMDSTAIIINETAVKIFGWTPENAMDRLITRNDNEGRKATYHVIGIVKDFHFRSMHERIGPLVMTLNNGWGWMMVKTRSAEVSGLVASMKKNWDGFHPDMPFSYTFLDERFNETYKAEQKTGQILGTFAGLTIFVACLGLFGLATFTAEQRTKEIGVRKVLGASVAGIITLLSKDFLKLVIIALLIATPAAWWLMDRWLQEFAYKIDVTWWMFALAGALSVLVALCTISYQSVKAALMNPVESLRSE
ncbi:putative ABC transport system permease protein [Dyadobacter sp. SG02]|uniref:ABC transporter permease n=1 Tax=Dyadobacter sp. SG02 TaxID=1855291 RepID=UPI0008C49AAB|nr:ABC transporter permease [Dyadobacter sp. SG02]SEI96491.1 putative ABC transport system permease protein [Dyadobacter sp. SG02]